MHVAMLIGALTKGGSERVLVNLADYLVRSGHRVTMVTQYQKENEYPLNENVKRVISDITTAETTRNRAINFSRRFFKLRNIWKREKPDVILSFIGKNNMMAILTSRFLPVSVAVAVRGDPEAEYYTGWMRKAARYLFRYADGVILQTEASRGFFSEAISKKAVILRNPVNSLFFRPRFQGEREKTIVAVGRIDENKNHRMLIQAFARIADEFPDYKVIIYGEGELRECLQVEVREMGLAERILLPGNTDAVAEKIYKSRVFVLTSDTEGVPNTLIEAMLMGLTVVATDCPCGGPAELIRHQENGWLIPVRDTEKMKDSLHFLLKNLQNADFLGEEASRLQSQYDPDNIGKSWENYLQSLI